MTQRPRPNPFYVLLLVASGLFVVTIMAYLVSPLVGEPAAGGAAARPVRGPAAWIDRTAPTALGVEIAVMIATGLLAMATDRWFAPPPQRPKPPGP
jgi:hypothetical protein